MTIPSQPDDDSLPPFSIASALDRRVASEFEERGPDGYWHPSALFGCLRQAIYASRGTEITDPRDDRSKRILRVGHQFHEYVQGAVNADPRIARAYEEVKILDDELRIKGSLDHIVVYRANDRLEVEEYKTINSNAFKYRDLPKPDHVGQLATYLFVLGRTGGLASDGTIIPPTDARGRIAYVSKDDLLVEEFTVLLTPGKERDIRRRIAYLDSYAAHGTALPPRLPDEEKKGKEKGFKRAFLCNYCPYQRRCWEEDGPGVDLAGGIQ